MKQILAYTSLVAAMLLMAPRPASAVTIYWDGSSSNNWSTSANWNTQEDGAGSDAAIGTGNDVVFTVTGGGGNLATTLGGSKTINSLTINGNQSVTPISIASNTLTIAAGIDMSAAAVDLSISSTVALSADQTWVLSATQLLTVTGPITGSTRTLTIDGSGGGQMNIGNTTNNSYNLARWHLTNGATLQAIQDNPFGDSTTVLELDSGTTFNANNFTDAFRGLEGSGAVTNYGNGNLDLRPQAGDTFTFSGTITANAGGSNVADFVMQGQSTTGTQIMEADIPFLDTLQILNGTAVFANTNGAMNLQTGAMNISRSDASTQLVGNSTLVLDSSTANHATQNRLNDTTTMNLRTLGEFKVIGNAVTATTEDIGTINLQESNTIDPHAIVTLQDGGAGVEVTSDSLTRSTGSSILFRGDNLGTGALGAGVTRLLFDAAPTLSNAGALGTTNAGIIPYAFGDNSSSGTGTDFVTYDVNGVRLLTGSEYAASIGGLGENIKLTANAVLAGNAADLSLNLAGTGVSLDLGGNTLTLDSNAILNSGSGAATISNGSIMFGNNAATGLGSFIFTPQDLLLQATIEDNGGTILTKSGAGTLTIDAPQNYTGNTSILEGTVIVTPNGNLGTFRTNLSGVLTFQGLDNKIGIITGSDLAVVNMPAGSTLELVGGSGDANFYGTLNGDATTTLIKSGGNTQNIRDVNTASFLGSVIIRGGTIQLLDANGRLDGAASFLVETGGTLELDNNTGSSNQNQNNRIGDSTPVSLNRGTLIARGSNNARSDETMGDLILLGGFNTVSLDADESPATAGSTTQGDIRLTADNLVRQNFATGFFRGDSFGEAIGGANGQANLIFATAPTLSGAGAGMAVGILPYITGGLTSGGGASTLVTYGPDGIRPLDIASTTTDYFFQEFAAAGVLSSASISGNNVYIDFTANSSDASLDLDATIGGLVIDNTGGSGSDVNIAGTTLTVEGGLIVSTGSSDNEFLAGGTITFGNNAATGYEGRIHGVRRIDVRSVIADNGGNSVSLTTDGTVYLIGANTYTGDTVINSGRIEINGGDDRLPTGTVLTANGNGILRLNTRSQEIGGLKGIGFVENNSASTDSTLTINTDNALDDFTFEGIIRDGNAALLHLIKTGPGKQTLSGSNPSTYTGGTSVRDGTLVLDGGVLDRVGSTSALLLGDGTTSGILQIGGASGSLDQSFSELATSGTGTSNAIIAGNAALSTLTINQANTTVFDGVIGGAGLNESNLNFIKDGAGGLTVNGSATLAGFLTVEAGSLSLLGTTNTLAGAVTVNSGSLLVGGTADIDGAITINSGEMRVTGSGLLGGVFPSTVTVEDGGSFIMAHGSTNQTFASAGNVLTLNQSGNTTQLGFGLDGATNDMITLGSGQTLTITGLIDTVIVVQGAPTLTSYLLIDTAADGSFLGGGAFQIGAIENAGNFIYDVARESNLGDPDQLFLTVTPNLTPPPDDAWWKGDLTGPAAGSWGAVQLGGDSNWDTSQSGGVDAAVPPGTNSHVHFSADGAGNFATQILQDFTIKALTFHANSGANGVSIGGTGILTIGNGVDTPSLDVLTGGNDAISITSSVVLGASQSWNIEDGSSVLTLSGGIGGTADLTINDNGTATGALLLSGAPSTLVGAVNVNAGSLIFEDTGSLTTANDVTLGTAGASATLQVGTSTAPGNATIGGLSNGSFAGSVVVGGNASISTLTLGPASGTSTFTGNIGGAGNLGNLALVKDGAGTQVLDGTVTYAGATTVVEGILQLGASSSFSPTGALSVLAESGATAVFDINGNNFTTTGVLTFGGADGTATPQIADTATGGLLTLGGNFLYDSTNDPLGGSISANMNLGGVTRTLTVNDSANAAVDLTISGTIDSAMASDNDLVFAGTGVTTLTSSAIVTITGSSADIQKNNSGTLNIDSTTATTDDWLVNEGIVNANVTGSLGSGDDVVIDGTGVADSAIVNLNAANVFSGDDFFIRNGGRANITVNDALDTTVDQVLVGDTASLGASAGRLDLAADFSIGANGLIVGGGNGNTGDVTGTGVITTDGAYSLREGSIGSGVTLAGTGAITKVTNGNLTFSGARTTTGDTNIQEGVLTLDYVANNASKIGGALTLGSNNGLDVTAGLTLIGSDSAATTDSVTSTSILRNHTDVTVNNGTGQTASLDLGAISRNLGGTINFATSSASSSITTTSTNTNGILGGWATFGDTAFAINDGANNIAALVASVKNDVSTWMAGDNVINDAALTGVVGGCNVVNSITIDAAAASTLTIGHSLVVQSGGILVTPNVSTNDTLITGGRIFGDTSSGELIVHQTNIDGNLEIASSLFLGALTKSGEGTLILSGANTFANNAQINVSQGTLLVTSPDALASNTIMLLMNSATLDINNGNVTIGRLGSNTSTSAPTSGGNINIGTGSLTINQTDGDGTAVETISSGDFFTGTGTIVKEGIDTLLIISNNTGFDGDIVVNAGRLHLDGANGAFASASGFTINGGGEVISQQDQTGNENKIGNSASVTLNNSAGTSLVAGRNGLWLQNQNQSAVRQENIGPVILGFGHNVIYSDTAQNNAAAVTDLIADNISRGSNHSTLLVKGLSLGASSGRRGLIRFDAAFSFGAEEVGGGGAAGTTNINIVPWIIGDPTATSSNIGNTFVTYQGTTLGLRPLDAGEYVTNEAGFNALTGAATDNVRFDTSPGAVLTSTATAINSLVLDSAGGVALTGPASALEITSGAVLAAGSASHVIDGFTSLTTGGGRDYIFYVTDAAGSLSVTPELSSTVALVKSGLGSLSLTNASSAFTDTYINQGTLEVDDLDKLGTGAVNLAGGTLLLTAGFADDLGGKAFAVLTGGGVLDIGANNVVATNLALSGSGDLSKRGTGTLTLGDSSAITHTGLFMVNQGTVELNNTLGNSVGAGGLLVSGNSNPSVVRLLVSDQIDDTAQVEIRTNGSNNQLLDLNNNSETIGSLILTSTSTTGTVVKTGATGVLAVDGDIYLNNNRTADASTTEFQVLITGSGAVGSRTTDGFLDLGGVDRRIIVETSQANQNFRNDAVIETVIQNGGIIKEGRRALYLRADNTYSGQTQINMGAIKISSSTNLGDGSATNTIAIRDGAILESTGALVDLGVNRSIDLFGTGGTLVVSGAATNRLVVPGLITGEDCTPLTKDGIGVLEFTEANTYAGGTVVAGGTLLVNNTSGSGTGSGGVTVNTGATLAGNGAVIAGSNLSINVDGTLLVGDLPPTATFGEDLALTTSGTGSTIINGTLSFDIWSGDGLGDNTGNSAAADLLVMSGATVLNASTSILQVTNPNSLTGWAIGDIWKLIDWTLVIGGPTNTFSGFDLPALDPGMDWFTDDVYTTGTISIVPEPGRASLLLLGLLGILARRRRKA